MPKAACNKTKKLDAIEGLQLQADLDRWGHRQPHTKNPSPVSLLSTGLRIATLYPASRDEQLSV
ncbi:hypothetical protein M426DRAFT_325688 [Hypoxylon sp. CI-4A]|nr:hypothetical protein M426DRAFT_325688 [Hypoxylon sp. CI-4A]